MQGFSVMLRQQKFKKIKLKNKIKFSVDKQYVIWYLLTSIEKKQTMNIDN